MGFIVTNTRTDTPDQPKEQKKYRTPNTPNIPKTGSPRTGDNSSLSVYLWLLLLAAGVIAVLMLRVRKERKR